MTFINSDMMFGVQLYNKILELLSSYREEMRKKYMAN